jgi:hypothetical protein
MAVRQVNWLRGQKHFDFSKVKPSQIQPRKDKIKAAALVKINRRLRALSEFKLKSVEWTKETGRPVYYLLVYLTPPAQFKRNGGGKGGGAKITPTPPTVP